MTIWPEKLALPFLAFAIEAVFSRIQIFPEWVIIPLFYILLFWFIVCNLRRGVWAYLFGAGTLLNFAVITANGFHMPVSAALFAESAYRDVYDTLANGDLFGYELAGAGTKISFFGDIFAFAPGGDLIGFASIGDLFLLVAILLLAGGMIRSSLRRKQNRNRLDMKK